MLQASCPKCGGKVALHPMMKDKPVKCPGCGTEFRTSGEGKKVGTSERTGIVEVTTRPTAGGPKPSGGVPSQEFRGRTFLIVGAAVLVGVLVLLWFLFVA